LYPLGTLAGPSLTPASCSFSMGPSKRAIMGSNSASLVARRDLVTGGMGGRRVWVGCVCTCCALWACGWTDAVGCTADGLGYHNEHMRITHNCRHAHAPPSQQQHMPRCPAVVAFWCTPVKHRVGQTICCAHTPSGLLQNAHPCCYVPGFEHELPVAVDSACHKAAWWAGNSSTRDSSKRDGGCWFVACVIQKEVYCQTTVAGWCNGMVASQCWALQ
jgi:hypothetical protein